jgi:glycosyltransferase involved in cell wall biosynthesis
MKKLFSVILPTYNRRRELERCLKSIKSQTFQDFEIIVVDDGSSDDTDEFIDAYHPDVRYFHQQNRGVARARNLGMEKAEGNYFAFIDSDDIWYPKRLDHLRTVIAQLPTNVGLIFNDMDRLIGGKGDGRSYSDEYFGVKRMAVIRSMNNFQNVTFGSAPVRAVYGNVFAELLNGNVIQPSCAVLKKEVYSEIGGFREDFRVANDSEYFLRASKYWHIGYVPLILTSLEPPKSSISLSLPVNSIEKIENTIKVIEGYRQAERDSDLKKRLIKRLARLHALLGYHYLSDYRRAEARIHYLNAIKLNTGEIKSFLMLWLSMLPVGPLKLLAGSKRLFKKKNEN